MLAAVEPPAPRRVELGDALVAVDAIAIQGAGEPPPMITAHDGAEGQPLSSLCEDRRNEPIGSDYSRVCRTQLRSPAWLEPDALEVCWRCALCTPTERARRSTRSAQRRAEVVCDTVKLACAMGIACQNGPKRPEYPAP